MAESSSLSFVVLVYKEADLMSGGSDKLHSVSSVWTIGTTKQMNRLSDEKKRFVSLKKQIATPKLEN